MKIHRIKLLSNYKKFKAGFEIYFSEEGIITITGVNGSGKSILLELILKIFQDIDDNLFYRIPMRKTVIKYEIDYCLNQTSWNDMKREIKIIKNLNWNVNVIMDNNEYFSCRESEYFSSLHNLHNSDIHFKPKNFYLPTKVVSYSSGLNENFSSINKNSTSKDMFHFIDNNQRNIILITLFSFFRGNNNITYLKDIANLYQLKCFNINFYTDLLLYNRGVNDEFQNLLTSNWEHQENRNPIFLDSMYTQNIKTLFNGYFNCYDEYDINDVGNEWDIKAFFDLLLHLKKYYEINDLKFETQDKNEISSKYISDGEMQLVEVLGAIFIYTQGNKELFFNDNILFLLDEPETHLNTDWKVKYIKLLEKCFNSNNGQIIFTTHNPEIISDLKPESLYHFKNNKLQEVTFNTFGAIREEIESKLFNKSSDVSEIALDKIKFYSRRIRNSYTKLELDEIKKELYYELADSYERTELSKEIMRKEREL